MSGVESGSAGHPGDLGHRHAWSAGGDGPAGAPRGPRRSSRAGREQRKPLSRVQLCNPMDNSLPGSSVHGILQARILEWAAMPFSRRSSQPRDRIQVSSVAGRFFTV